MSYIPSHNNRTNERSERRQNWKLEMRRASDAKKPQLSQEAIEKKFDKLAAAMLAGGKVEFAGGNYYRVYVGAGKKFYPVSKIAGKFVCACNDDLRYGTCAHARACAAFAAKKETEEAANRSETEKPFRATLRFGNRKGNDFEKTERFATKRKASEWLVREAFNKLEPEGEVTDLFGATVFEITDEFFDLWEEV